MATFGRKYHGLEHFKVGFFFFQIHGIHYELRASLKNFVEKTSISCNFIILEN